MAIDTQQLANMGATEDVQNAQRANQGGQTKNSGLNFSLGVKLSAKDRMFFTEQLALLLDTGNSLSESLSSLAQHAPSKEMRDLLNSLDGDIQQGSSLSHALAQHPEVFNVTYCNLIKASESGGFMAEVLEELQQMDEKRERLQATMQSALSYPVFLASFSLLVVVFVLVVVFPKFSDMFAAIADDLPASTKMLMAVSDSLIGAWPVYLTAALGSGAAFYVWKQSLAGRTVIDAIKLKIPVFRDVFSELYLVQSMRVMGLSLSKDVSIMDTLASSRDVVDNELYRQFFRRVESDVQEGHGLSKGFRDCEFIPDLVKQMITTGESSGSLPKVMGRIAQYYERQLEKRLTTLSKAAEPVMLLVMGVVVGVLVSSLILPIFQMSRMTN